MVCLCIRLPNNNTYRFSVLAMRVEYLRARARVQRYREQIAILKEEKRRVLVSLEYEAEIWDSRRAAQLIGVDSASAESEGRAVYAAKQAAVRRRLASKFAVIWSTPVTAVDAPNPAGEPSAGEEPLVEEPEVIELEESEASAVESDSEDED